ncbi:MAG: Zn-dependent hydrolase, partial [Anaerolineae bacterium]|nr:Zn-dependent hydrolase [Anaerolineae bacterium]
LADLQALGEIGRTPAGGLARTTFSAADFAGREWFRQRVLDAGLQFYEDGAGNLSAILGESGPTILFGSHLDTVPNGGRYDGALGVLSALEALRTIQETGIVPPVRLEVISFTDEEGTHSSMIGSRAVTGALTPDDLLPIQHVLTPTPYTPASILAAKRNPTDYRAFLEVHIEQGKRLERAGIDIGVVTNIVGIRHFWLAFTGQANHSGTTPMDQRTDALWGAAEFVGRGKTLVMERFTPGVMNCGDVQVAPGAHNIVPGQVRLAFEIRHGTTAQMDDMEQVLFALAQETADQYHLRLSIESLGHVVPAELDDQVIAAIERAAATLNLSHTRLMSFAGHDTQNMSRFTPSAMFFVPSVAGFSHNPQEFTRDQDVINAANVVLQTVLHLIEATDQ